MSWVEILRSMEARDHVYTVTPRESLHRDILPTFVRRAIGLRGEVELCFPSPDLATVKMALEAAIPELGRWQASGLVRFREGDSVAEVFKDPTPAGLRILRTELAKNYRSALVRGRTVWYVGGVSGWLHERGLVSQALFGEMFVQNTHWVVPMAMLCPYYGPMDGVLEEGLEEIHDGGI
jgi:hypothetical protein